MKPLALLLAFTVTSGALPALAQHRPDIAVHSPATGELVLDAVRPRWPVAKEPGGGWGVVGEATVRHALDGPVTVSSVAFAVFDDHWSLLALDRYDTPAALAAILQVATPADEPIDTWRPAGTTEVAAGDTAVLYLATLTARRPHAACVTVAFGNGEWRRRWVPLEAFTPGQAFTFPLRLDGRPWVATGTAGTPHHWAGGSLVADGAVFISQRFALDLRRVDEAWLTHPTGTTHKEDYYAWGADVLSMGVGRVVAAVTDQRDVEIDEQAPATAHPAGNHVVVQYGPRLFAVFAHLQAGTVAVRVGDWITRGRVVGKVGNSGNSSEPHLHVHVTDAWRGDDPFKRFYQSQGVPALFWGARVLRDDAVLPLRGASPLEGDLVGAWR